MPDALAPQLILDKFEELIDELETDVYREAVSHEQGCYHKGLDIDIKKDKIRLIAMMKAALGLTPTESCEKCGGTGSVETTDWVPYGNTNVRMVQNFQCDNLSDGHCCQCGSDVDKETKLCEGCGKEW